jgi:hypothetical protein
VGVCANPRRPQGKSKTTARAGDQRIIVLRYKQPSGKENGNSGRISQ